MKLAMFSLVELRPFSFPNWNLKIKELVLSFEIQQRKPEWTPASLTDREGEKGPLMLGHLGNDCFKLFFFFFFFLKEFWGRSLVWLKPVETAHPLPLPRNGRKYLMGMSVLLTSEDPKPTLRSCNCSHFLNRRPMKSPEVCLRTHRPPQARTANYFSFPSLQSPFPTPQTTD